MWLDSDLTAAPDLRPLYPTPDLADMPGERLDVHMWNDGDQTLFQTRVGDRVVFDAGVFTSR